ncbi:LAME_0D00738g1_1 [Lachancea meyersii CBS 8951]|uniref:LAME_0D00738g1_1 n=1 Tax=Lachancea meyersii CBS 8951 TaxID=1266667 RepID=A0A1G4J606_9SACH|nr:LAME_0D00738g1_1 [Lachancea meyersii CBS 8951]
MKSSRICRNINAPRMRLTSTIWLCRAASLRYTSSCAHLKYCEQLNKSFLHIKGPDAVKFLNGLVTSKMLPTYVKKNLTTIEVVDDSLSDFKAVTDFDTAQGNWGIFKEVGANGPYISRFGTYTGLLNSKGKIMTDAIIYPTPVLIDSVESRKYPEYLVEVNRDISAQINHIFQSHTLVSKVKSKLEPTGKLKSWYLSLKFPAGIADENPWLSDLIIPMETVKAPTIAVEFAKHVLGTFFRGHEDKVLGLFIDPRNTELLYESPDAPQVFRLVTSSDVADVSNIFHAPDIPFDLDIQKIAAEDIRVERFTNGYVDGLTDFKQETVLPLELNFDFIPNAVSFDKGCYVGQELTARTFSTGVLRKRAVPVVLENAELLESLKSEKYLQVWGDSPSTTDTAILAHGPFAGKSATRKRRRPAGSLLCYETDRGVAILRNEYLREAFELGKMPDLYIEIESAGSKVRVIPQKPQWYEEWSDEFSEAPTEV